MRLTKLLYVGVLKREENRDWQKYLTIYPYLTNENFISFEDFRRKNVVAPVEQKSEVEILQEVKEILDTFKGGE